MNIRKSNKSDISGWLNINKESNISSAKVVAIVKKLTGAKKVGHAGTLDPLATGVIPICNSFVGVCVNYRHLCPQRM